MSSELAAPCRHAGAPPDSLVERVAAAIAGVATDKEFLSRSGLTSEEFNRALPAAIERIRGSAAASNSDRRHFLSVLLESLAASGLIEGFESPRYGDDTVYRLQVPNLGVVAIIQKGCPDGAHSSTRWEVQDWAKESYLWWLCPSMAHQPGEHIAKGVNRLRGRFFGTQPGELDGVVFHNEMCGGNQRPCPKLVDYGVRIGDQLVPPPCIYVLPRRQSGATEWNWDGSRMPRFPSVLLAHFGIDNESLPRFVGHVGFQERGGSIRTTIVSRYGSGRSTTFRS
jgi:hypothetical protein